MSKLSDFETFCKAIEEMMKPSKDFNVNYNFYYDETNNTRVFKINKNGQFNFHKDKDFVLGGVGLEKGKYKEIENAFNELRVKLKVHSSLKELKFINVCPRGSDFLKCIHNKKVHDLLQWILDRDIYIHFTVLDHLFYSIADIIESLRPNRRQFGEDNDTLKTMLYHFVYDNTEAFIQILNNYNYPDVGSKKNTLFYNDLINCIMNTKNNSVAEKDWKLELYFYFKKYMHNPPIYLENNKKKINEVKKEKILIEEYYLLFRNRVQDFKHAFHFFDEELTVQDEFEKIEGELKQFKYTNYKFLDSKDNILIQLSDLVVGLLGKLFEFIKKIPIDFIYNLNFKINDYYSFDEHHQKGWNLLLNLISKSIRKNEAFINMPSNKLFRAKFNKIMELDYQEFLI